jgi:hypothetical protein
VQRRGCAHKKIQDGGDPHLLCRRFQGHAGSNTIRCHGKITVSTQLSRGQRVPCRTVPYCTSRRRRIVALLHRAQASLRKSQIHRRRKPQAAAVPRPSPQWYAFAKPVQPRASKVVAAILVPVCHMHPAEGEPPIPLTGRAFRR